ncbi:MAG: C_GCAxxG_C_C family protein [Eubacterium sp.]|nr:C_GCAxxG_C_C family protein [Eubacterium sp.]
MDLSPTKGKLAENYFRNGYNCSQSVALAFCDEMNMEKDTVARLTIGFGGGVGRMREICGAVSGIAFVLSALYGDKGRAYVYALIQNAAKKFRCENGSIVCHELLGIEEPVFDPIPEKRTVGYYKKRPCPHIIHKAADILDEILQSQKK